MKVESHLDRIAAAVRIRADLADPARLALLADRVLRLVPKEAPALVAWTPEGHVVAGVASVVARASGRELCAVNASHVAPLGKGPSLPVDWAWASVEEALGFGPPRPWALNWVTAAGGQREPQPLVFEAFAEVA